MQIQCPRCQTKYNLDEALLSPEGSQVRCSRCGHEFLAKPPAHPQDEPEPVPPPPGEDDDLMGLLDDDDDPIKGFDLEEDEEGSRRSPFKKILIFLLILIIILGLLLGGVLFLKSRGTNLDEDYLGLNLYHYLPFLAPAGPEGGTSPGGAETKQDPGKNRIYLVDVSGSLLELEELGQVFVIKGKVKNSSDQPVKEIKLRGILHTEERRNAAESIVFAGHLFSNEELQTLTRSVIEEILTNPQTVEGPEAGVKPGEMTDFMIIFFDLPENLLEFTVEVVSSRSASDKSN